MGGRTFTFAAADPGGWRSEERFADVGVAEGGVSCGDGWVGRVGGWGKEVRNVLFDGGVSAVWDILGGGVGVGGGSVVG